MRKNDSVRTPKHIIQALQEKYFKFNVYWDATPYNKNFCKKKDVDGLTTNWKNVTFCNPPYSKSWKFLLKANEEYTKHEIKSILLVKVGILCTKTFQTISKNCSLVFFPKRITFENYSSPGRFGNVSILFGYKNCGNFDIFNSVI